MRISAAILPVVLVLASCGGSGSKPSSSTIGSSPGPTGSSGATESAPPKAAAPARPHSRAPRVRSGGSNVKVSFLQKSLFGAKSQVVYFVVRGHGTPLAQAKSCVKRNRRFAPSAYCFAFASERAFRFSRVARRPPAKMGRPCWAAYWGKPSGRREIGSAHNPAAQPLHCPD
jgi:hypothetical protein